MSTSSVGDSPSAVRTAHGTPPSRAATVRAGQRSVPGSAISAFCDHFPVKTVSSVVGANEHLLEAVIENTSYEHLPVLERLLSLDMAA